MQNIQAIIISCFNCIYAGIIKRCCELILWTYLILLFIICSSSWEQVNKNNITNKKGGTAGVSLQEKKKWLQHDLQLELTQYSEEFTGLIQQYLDIWRFMTENSRKTLSIPWPITPIPGCTDEMVDDNF